MPSSEKKKINNLDQYPLLNPPYMVCDYLYLTTQYPDRVLSRQPTGG